MISSSVQFVCKECGKEYASKGNLGHHYQTSATHMPREHQATTRAVSTAESFFNNLKANDKIVASKCSTHHSMKHSASDIRYIMMEEIDMVKSVLYQEISEARA